MGRLNYSSLSFLLSSATQSDVILEVTTLSYARGQAALKVYSTPTSAATSSNSRADSALSEPSVHANFNIIDDFSAYAAGTETLAEAGWDNSSLVLGATFGKIFPTVQNFSDYTSLSLWAKSEYKVCLYVSFKDTAGKQTTPLKFGYLSPRWKRMDGNITYPTGFNKSSVERILFTVDAEPSAEYYIDEIIAFGCNDSNKNKLWTKLLITDMDTKKTGRTSISEIAGGFGDIIHQDGAISLRGNMTFKTGHLEKDDDIRFVDSARRHQTKLFLRVGGEGWPVYLSDYKQRPEKTIYGIRNELDLQFIEA
jgi:hypothetical protein